MNKRTGGSKKKKKKKKKKEGNCGETEIEGTI